MAVVPTTRLQSATAADREAYCAAAARTSAAGPTADRASRNDGSNGLTTLRCTTPKLLMARAAAPRLSGLRVATRTTHRRSSSEEVGKGEFYDRQTSCWVIRAACA